MDHRSKDTEAIMYFDFLLPRLKDAYPDVAIPEWIRVAARMSGTTNDIFLVVDVSGEIL